MCPILHYSEYYTIEFVGAVVADVGSVAAVVSIVDVRSVVVDIGSVVSIVSAADARSVIADICSIAEIGFVVNVCSTANVWSVADIDSSLAVRFVLLAFGVWLNGGIEAFMGMGTYVRSSKYLLDKSTKCELTSSSICLAVGFAFSTSLIAGSSAQVGE